MDELKLNCPTWYETNSVDMLDIVKVQVQRFTSRSVWIVGSNGKIYRKARISDYKSYYPSFREARYAIMERLNNDMETHYCKAEKLRTLLGKVFLLGEKS